jgi:hypothetical protein
MLAETMDVYCASWPRIPKVLERSWRVPFEEKISRIEWSYGFVKRSPAGLGSGVRKGGLQSEAFGLILLRK